MSQMNPRPEMLDWLLDSDPAIRWQVMRDLLHKPPAVYQLERDRLAHSGWCAQLLNLQDDDGRWNRSLYNGKWISTTYTLYLLKLLGLPPGHEQALLGCQQLLDGGLYRQQEIRFSRRQHVQDLGVTALVLSLCSYFGGFEDQLVPVLDFLIGRQCEDGCWLPNDDPASEPYAFETTLLVLEAFYQVGRRNAYDPAGKLAEAVARGQDFLLRHHLYLDAGQPIKSRWTTFSFPPYWFYNVLTALDYFCRFQRNRDSRLEPALDLLLQRQRADGVWALGAAHPGKTYFEMEKPGRPSRWNTLRALRVLDWRAND